jgi:hypothetical protein
MASRRSWVRIPSAPPFEKSKRSYLRKPLTASGYCCQLSCFFLHSNMNLSRFAQLRRASKRQLLSLDGGRLFRPQLQDTVLIVASKKSNAGYGFPHFLANHGDSAVWPPRQFSSTTKMSVY